MRIPRTIGTRKRVMVAEDAVEQSFRYGNRGA
jgi:ribosomal protein L32E